MTEYDEENIPCIEIACGLAEGIFQYYLQQFGTFDLII